MKVSKFYLPTDAQNSYFKRILKFTLNFNILLKQLYCASVGK